MAPAFDIPRRAPESENEKIAQTLFGACKIVVPVHGSQNVILWNPAVESGRQTCEAFLTDYGIDFVILHKNDAISNPGRGSARRCECREFSRVIATLLRLDGTRGR